MILDKNQIENVISEYLSKRGEVIFAYIFGSFVEKVYYHDVDIAVYLSDEFDKNDLKKFPYGYESNIAGAIMELLHTDKIDFVVLNNAPIVLSNRIINTGKLLFDKDKFKRVTFENKKRKMFIDTENLRKIRTHYLLRKINSNA